MFVGDSTYPFVSFAVRFTVYPTPLFMLAFGAIVGFTKIFTFGSFGLLTTVGLFTLVESTYITPSTFILTLEGVALGVIFVSRR